MSQKFFTMTLPAAHYQLRTISRKKLNHKW